MYLKAGEKIPSAFELNKLVTQWKKQEDLAWLKEVYTDNLQQKLKELHGTWMRCFDKSLAAYKPRFKKKAKNKTWSNSLTSISIISLKEIAWNYLAS